jgi:D-alanyl-D-alanine carboxypeptidase
VRYGLGVMIRPTPLGESWGHSGFFPGYATELHHVDAVRLTVALQVNVTDPYPRTMNALVLRVLQVARSVGAAS